MKMYTLNHVNAICAKYCRWINLILLLLFFVVVVDTRLMSIFQNNPGKLVPECLHSTGLRMMEVMVQLEL